MEQLLGWAHVVSEEAIAPLGRRWLHVQQVARMAARLAPRLGLPDGQLEAAALLHDIGYAPALAVTGFHPLDGARFVRDQGQPELAQLVAHHTGARNEARLRGIDALELEFPFADSLAQRALTYCDLTTGPDGSPTDVRHRVEEIVQRYGEDHVVSRSALIGLREFLAIEDEIEGLLNLSAVPVSDR